MQTRHRVLGLIVVLGLYLGVVLWPRTPHRTLPPLPTTPQRSGSAQQAARPGAPAVPAPALGGGPLADRGSLSIPPPPKGRLNVIPPVPPAPAGEGPAPYRLAPRRARGDKVASLEPAWADSSGRPVVHLPQKLAPGQPRPAERAAIRDRKKQQEKLGKRSPRLQRHLARAERYRQAQQERRAGHTR